MTRYREPPDDTAPQGISDPPESYAADAHTHTGTMTTPTAPTAPPRTRMRPVSLAVDAGAAALAWSNAFLAASQEEGRPLLYRTLAVEFFSNGVQFVATDGVLLFRTWVSAWQEDAEWPEDDLFSDDPLIRVVVMDRDHFALGFIKTLMAATKELAVTLTMAVEEAPERGEGEPALGDEFSTFVLTLRALGQQLHCRLFEDEFPNWRGLDLGIPMSERIPGTTLATKTLATLGKLKHVTALELDFTGANSRINITSWATDTIRGLVMPMRRIEKEKKPAPTPDTQTEIEGTAGIAGGKVIVDGEWVDATPGNMRKAAERVAEGIARNRRRGRPGESQD